MANPSIKLSDLPAMTVLKVERVSGVLCIDGRFDRLDGVRSGGYFLIARGEYVWADLDIVDRAQGTVRFTEERDSDVARLRVGEKYIWLDDYWQAPLVEAIADEATVWHSFTFASSDASKFRQGVITGWQPVGQPLPEGAEPLGIEPLGWDHEHCGICDDHIDEENPIGYADDFSHFLCAECHAKHGATHDLSFLL